ISRSHVVKTDPTTAFNVVKDFSTWKTWSPWLLAEPDCKIDVESPADDVGCGYEWDGKVVGAGKMKNTQLTPPSEGQPGVVLQDLTFLRPMRSNAKIRFDLQPVQEDGEDATRIIWTMDSSIPFFIFWMKPMIQSLVGMDYKRGLSMLGEWLETGSIAAKTTMNGIDTLPAMRLATLPGETTFDEIGADMDETISRVTEKLQAAEIEPSGTWASLYHDANLTTGVVRYSVGMVMPEDQAVPDHLIESQVESSEALHVTQQGAYEHIGNGWFCAHQHLQNNRELKRKANSRRPGVEIYENSPKDTPREELLTQIFIPVK
ncbi:MAG: GyrI-like domain-containing protein, partial [Planctomycetota bacterium]